jgi:hypothetical protein
MKYEHSESQRLGQAFIIACQPTKASYPDETALHPTARQQDKITDITRIWSSFHPPIVSKVHNSL